LFAQVQAGKHRPQLRVPAAQRSSSSASRSLLKSRPVGKQSTDPGDLRVAEAPPASGSMEAEHKAFVAAMREPVIMT